MIEKIRYIVKKYFSNFAYFYKYLRYRLFVILGLSLMVGIMDGFGLAMFLPLLEFVAGDGDGASDNMGSLSFLIEWLNTMNLELNLTVVLLTMLSFFTLKGGFKFLEQYKNTVYLQFFIRNLREENISDLANYRYEDFVKSDAGRIQNTLTLEIHRVSTSLRHYMRVIQNVVLVMVYTVLAFMVNAEFAILVLIGGVLTNLLFNKLYTITKQYSLKVSEYNQQFQGLLIQQVSNFKYLKATGHIRNYARKLIRSVNEIELSVRKIGVLDAIISGVREPLMIGVVIVVILIQVNLMGGSLGLIILSILFFYRALTAVMYLQQYWNRFLEMTGSLQNLQELSKELKNGKESTGHEELNSFQSTLQLQNVSFSYGDVKVIQDLSLGIYKNEIIAIVGESGSGKTTLMNLISGILKPQDGIITIDDTDYKDINIESLQKRIGYITQEPVIFADSVYNNITFWSEKSEDNIVQLKKALKLARIDHFVKSLPEKEDSLLGNNGINLSGGQKQRLSIARELYKDVDFLFMDEATSSLDSETEKNIQENIEQLRGKYTIIIIAHRLSTIKNADRVILMKNGKVDQVGNYEKLVEESPEFKRMVELQGA